MSYKMQTIKISRIILQSGLALLLTHLPLQTVHAAEASGQAATQQAFELKTLQQLFDKYQRKKAYEYARKHLKQMEGDPYFDYFYGVSAIDTGHASEGVFALERVLLQFPNDQVARLELARGYFVLQEYALSREAFERVLQSSPPSQVRDTAEAYLDRIRVSESRYRPTHSGFISLALGDDDNTNGGIDENKALEIFDLVSPESVAQEDNYTELSGGWTYSHPFRPGWFMESTLSGNLRKNQDLDQYDTTTATLQLGVVHLKDSNRYKAEILTQQFNLDGDKYRTLNNLTLDWQHSLSEQSSITTTFQYGVLDYPDIPGRNSNLMTLGLSHSHGFSVWLQPLVFTSLSLSQENADEDTDAAKADTERDIVSVRAGLILSFTNTLALQTALGLQQSEYAGAPLFDPDTTREDDYTTADLGLLWAFARKWRLDTTLRYTENDSSYNLYDYERTLFSVNLSYTY